MPTELFKVDDLYRINSLKDRIGDQQRKLEINKNKRKELNQLILDAENNIKQLEDEIKALVIIQE
jgi:septal ring factor EnvC (AmiA/AmiB activator)